MQQRTGIGLTTKSLSALFTGVCGDPSSLPFIPWGGQESKPWKDRTVEAPLEGAEGSIHSHLLYVISPEDTGPLQSMTHPGRQAYSEEIWKNKQYEQTTAPPWEMLTEHHLAGLFHSFLFSVLDPVYALKHHG